MQKFSMKNFQANNLKSADKTLMYYQTNCRVFIITVLNKSISSFKFFEALYMYISVSEKQGHRMKNMLHFAFH